MGLAVDRHSGLMAPTSADDLRGGRSWHEWRLGLIAGLGTPRLDLVSIASAVASCLGNVGPGLSQLGPTEIYAIVPLLRKWLLALLMIIGRLEIIPIVILVNREAWRS